MGLFEEIQNQSSNYISIGFAIEGLASHEGSIYKAVMVMLHYKFDELLSCYKKDEFHSFIDIDNDQLEEYSAFQILNAVKEYAKSLGGIDSNECYLSEEFKKKIKDYYWGFEAYFNLEPIKKSVDKYHQKKVYNENDYRFFLFKKPLLTFHEASCILTGYDPQYVEQCQNDTNFKQNFSNYLGAKDYIHACTDAHMLCYNPMDSRIDADDFKKFLAIDNTFIDGFNDHLKNLEASQNSSIQGNTVDQLEKENEKLRAELLDKELKIKELESDRISEQSADISPNDLIGLAKINQLAKDRKGMARVIALSLWNEDKNILIGDMADKVYKAMIPYCREELPQLPETLKGWIRPIATDEAQKKVVQNQTIKT